MNEESLKRFWLNKSVLITGASSGLGWALVEALAPYKITFCLLSRRDDRMKELAYSLRNSGSTFWIKSCDIRCREDVQNAITSYNGEFGKIDVAWINSGVAESTFYNQWKWEVFENIINTNLKGSIYTIKTCIDYMKQQKNAAIVVIGSIVSMRGLPRRGVYGLTKIGLEYFIESLAVEMPQIHFTLIHPGYVDTSINQGQPNRLFLMDSKKAAKRMIKAVALHKIFYIYPWQMKFIFCCARLLPASLYQKIGKLLFLMKHRAD